MAIEGGRYVGLGGTWIGIPSNQVVAVVARLDTERVQIGSGYLIGARRVLTAQHCTVDTKTGRPVRSLRVVRRSDGAGAPATLLAAALDVAVLEVDENPAWPISADLEPPRFGRVERSHSMELRDCEAVGFPLWQLDPRDQQRNAAELHGTIRVTEDIESGLLVMRDPLLDDIGVPGSAADEDWAEGSPWGGLSGALVFCQGIALGVIIEHHPRKGRSAITILPVDRFVAPAVHGEGGTEAVAAALELPLTANKLPFAGVRRRPRPPSAPPGAVGRSKLAAATLDALRAAPAPLVTLVGGPGFGKSVLARLVAGVVDAAGRSDTGSGRACGCPGGVVWLDVGQDPDLSGLLAQRLTDLTREPASGLSVEQMAGDLGDWLAAHRCLLVLDDVWPAQQGKNDVVAILLSRIDNVPRLITTRSSALLDEEPGAWIIDVEEMNPGEAAALLATALPRQASQDETAQLDDFARRIGRWPLLLGLAAAHLRRRVSGGVPLGDAVRDLAERFTEKGVTAFDARHAHLLDARDPAQRNLAVAATVEASLGLLTRDDQACYRDLAVFPPGQPIPIEVIVDLWVPTLDRDGAEDLLGTLADMSLLSMDWKTREVRVHDMLRGYLIPADRQQRARMQRGLLQSWGPPLLLQDSYRIRWYCYHLDSADDSDQLYALITPAWRDQVLAVTGALSDVAADASRAAEHAASHQQLPEELRCRLITSSLAARAQALPRPFLAALARLGRLDRALGYATLLSPSERGAALADIAMALVSADPGQALAVADRIEDRGHKARALAEIAAGQVRIESGQALAVDLIDDPPAKAEALTDVAAGLASIDRRRASRLADEAIAAAELIGDPLSKAAALTDVVAGLASIDRVRASRLAEEAVAVAGSIVAPGHKARALAAVAAAVVDADPDRALAAAERIGEAGAQAEVLAEIAAVLADTDPARASRVTKRAVTAANRIDHPGQKVKALIGIAIALANTDPEEALAVAEQISAPGAKARVLTDVAVALAGTDPERAGRLAEMALVTAGGVDAPGQREQVLAGIAAALVRTDPDQALAAADRIDDLGRKAEVLADIVAALVRTGADSALLAADRIDDPGRKAQILAVPALASVGADRAIAAADLINHPGQKAQALARIAAVLVRTDPDRATLAIDRISDPERKVQAFADMAAVLAGLDPDRAMVAVNRISDPGRMARVLARIAPAMARIDPDRAMIAADRINDPERKARTLTAIAAALACIDPDRAMVAADQINDLGHKAQALAGIAVALAATDPSHASRLIDQALAVADRIEAPWARAEVLADIAAALTGIDPDGASQLTDRALAAADRIDEPGRKADALAHIAAALPQVDADRAAVATQHTDDLGAKTVAFANTAPAPVLLDHNRTAAAPDRIDDAARKEQALIDIVAALARRASQLAHQAVAATDRIADAGVKARALADVAAALVGTDPRRASQLTERAVATADRIVAPFARAEAFAGVAAALTSSDPSQAVAAAERITIPGRKADALAHIAAALIGVDPGRALDVADRVNDPVYKAQALAGMSAALARAGRARGTADSIHPSSYKAEAVVPVHTIDSMRDRPDRQGITDELLTRIRSLDPATGHAAWWSFARLLITLETSASERDGLVKAVLAADEW